MHKKTIWGNAVTVICYICYWFLNFGSILLPWVVFVLETFLLFLVTDSSFASSSPLYILAIYLPGLTGDSEYFAFP